MKRYVFLLVLIASGVLFFGFLYLYNLDPNEGSFQKGAAAPDISSFSEYFRGKVTSVLSEEERTIGQSKFFSQTFKLKILDGSERDKEVEIENNNAIAVPGQKVQVGETVVVGKLQTPEGASYVLVDKYRMKPLLLVVGLFFLLALIFGRLRGLTALVGLGFSIFLLVYFIAPSILSGKDALLVSLVGGGLIALAAIFLAHGVNERSALATISTFLTLGLAAGLAYWFIDWSQLFGLGTESAFYIQSGFLGSVDLKGLLLAGIIIGAVGVLDDITVSQTALVGELHRANNELGFKELFKRASIVGREHIGSLINTLVLAYAGASFPLFLLFTLIVDQPLWTIINSEFIAEEIVRTIVGSSALILAVPISSLLSAYYFSRQK